MSIPELLIVGLVAAVDLAAIDHAGIPLIDVSRQTDRRVIVDEVEGAYMGQPDTVLLADGKTILAGFPLGHGGPHTRLKRSDDGGLSWSDRLPVPRSFDGDHNAPTIHRLKDPRGKERLLLFVSYPVMKKAVSEDNGRTWSELEPVFGPEMKGQPGNCGYAPPKSVIPISGGRYLTMYHDRIPSPEAGQYRVALVQTTTQDGGLSWSKPRIVSRHPELPGAHPCEPALIRSPGGEQILCLARENTRQYRSLWMVSNDEGHTWSDLREAPRGLTGDRHIPRYTLDGRLITTIRDMDKDSPTYGDFVLWVGRYADVVQGRPGQYRVRLLDNRSRPGETGYAGLERLPDGTFVSTTYCDLTGNGRRDPVIVSLRFRMEEFDRLAGQKPAFEIPVLDLNDHTHRQVIVDKEPGQYLGHPTTVLLEDSQTMLCVYPLGHGRGAIVYKRSADAGLSWSERLPTPASWATSKEVPTLHRVIDAAGNRRVIMFSGLYPARMAVTENDGETWSELEAAGDWGGIVVMGDVKPLKTGKGHYMALFHDDGRFFTGRDQRRDPKVMTLYKTFSTDGGLTWSSPEAIHAYSAIHICEPGIVRSPGGGQLAVLLRENSRRRNSQIIFSNDEGRTWSLPRALPGSLNGDRHTARYAPDGRLFISFRSRSPEGHTAPAEGDWVAWVGAYDDLVSGREGQYHVRLKDNTRRWDCAYPAVEVLPDGTFVTTTYGHWDEGEEPYILSVRIKLDELDAMAKSPSR